MEDGEGGGDIGEPLEAAPEGGSTGMAVALAPEEAAELGYHAHRLAQCGWRRGRGGRAMVVAVQGLPLGLLEEYRAGDIGGLAPKLGQMHHPPGDHQIDGKTGLQAVGVAEAAVLDAAAAFEGAMKHLDTPSLTPL